MNAHFRLIGCWTDVYEVLQSVDPAEVGTMVEKPFVRSVRRQYKTREAAEQALPHFKQQYPDCAVWTIEEFTPSSTS